MVAGPYSAPTAEERAANLARLNRAAGEIARRGHVPVVGVNAALPVLEALGFAYSDPMMMTISLALAERCDAVLQLARSPGADREVAAIGARGRPIYTQLADIPPP